MSLPDATAWTLPWRGLGLSSNLDAADQPHPYRLLAESPGLFDFVEYSAPLSLDETRESASLFPRMWERREEVPVLFHPVHLNLYGPELEPVKALEDLDAHARAVGSAWVGNDIGWWHSGGQPFPGYLYFTPPFTEAGVRDCVAHALHVQSHLSVPLALENPAAFAKRGELHVLDFMARVQERTGLPLLLDLGHLLSYQLAAGLPLEAGLDGFPLDKIIEIHIAGGVITRRGGRGYYVDDHTQPVREELFGLLESLLPRCPSLRAVTFEGDGHPLEVALLTLRRLREWVPAAPRPPLALTPVKQSAPPLSRESEPWALFETGYAAKPEPGGDVDGARAETDFRLAVVAETLDRDWPISRLLLAGTREDLSVFTASQEFRGLFEGEGRSPGHAFAAWTRRHLREHPDEGVAAAVSFETFLPNSFMMRPPPVPGPGQVGLAEDVRVGTFPVDLTELVFAAKSLRRHLTGRAWACEVLEVSGLEALAQVARRPGRGPWTFVVRRKSRSLEVLTVPPSVLELLRSLARGARAVEEVPAQVLAEGRALGLLRRG
ncbi:DUF692 family multinuclear iron-containing protein [Vitiosangium sp. GDMCC 1.1324]|uniref:DUF692 domain-containing protein n=1 Tax=Vitiosangium sp. (strain GDMCC 1.1324) TaxID=2138576 RepID=UPI000D3C3213|nr:DUF692 family multinuclear iron-containing protein [Vitiosangium sp. GDMCC 1.1324]PTL85338.1 hypothetical protein DAT35_01035 [Vitiosangium sp. GDMCC 1.1324]